MNPTSYSRNFGTPPHNISFIVYFKFKSNLRPLCSGYEPDELLPKLWDSTLTIYLLLCISIEKQTSFCLIRTAKIHPFFCIATFFIDFFSFFLKMPLITLEFLLFLMGKVVYICSSKFSKNSVYIFTK
jgi:hypothetical protein